MKQRVSLCRALIADPDILLMDEPFSALDAITRDDMNVVLLDLWERYRKTVLFVTHSIREAALLVGPRSDHGRQSVAMIIADIKVPFARPRHFTSAKPPEFNELCTALRDEITKARSATSRRETLTWLKTAPSSYSPWRRRAVFDQAAL